jgi:hypothetical protein
VRRIREAVGIALRGSLKIYLKGMGSRPPLGPVDSLQHSRLRPDLGRIDSRNLSLVASVFDDASGERWCFCLGSVFAEFGPGRIPELCNSTRPERTDCFVFRNRAGGWRRNGDLLRRVPASCVGGLVHHARAVESLECGFAAQTVGG